MAPDLFLTDFDNLAVPTSPNTWLVAPAGFEPAKPDAAAPVFELPAKRLAQAWISVVESEPRTKILAVSEDGLQIEAEQRSAVFGFLDRISTKCVTLEPTRSTPRCLQPIAGRVLGFWRQPQSPAAVAGQAAGEARRQRLKRTADAAAVPPPSRSCTRAHALNGSRCACCACLGLIVDRLLRVGRANPREQRKRPLPQHEHPPEATPVRRDVLQQGASAAERVVMRRCGPVEPAIGSGRERSFGIIKGERQALGHRGKSHVPFHGQDWARAPDRIENSSGEDGEGDRKRPLGGELGPAEKVGNEDLGADEDEKNR